MHAVCDSARRSRCSILLFIHARSQTQFLVRAESPRQHRMYVARANLKMTLFRRVLR